MNKSKAKDNIIFNKITFISSSDVPKNITTNVSNVFKNVDHLGLNLNDFGTNKTSCVSNEHKYESIKNKKENVSFSFINDNKIILSITDLKSLDTNEYIIRNK